MMKIKTRVELDNTRVDKPTTRYYYDGQMGIEEDHTYIDNETNVKDVTRYGIGARGIDWMSFSANGAGAVISFPIYDGLYGYAPW